METVEMLKIVSKAIDEKLSNAENGNGVMLCPICKTGNMTWKKKRGGKPSQRKLFAYCSTGVCVTFQS